MPEELVYLGIFTQTLPKSAILVENWGIGWSRLLGPLYPIDQSIFRDVHPLIKNFPELFFIPF